MLDIYAYDKGFQEGGYPLFSGNRPGIAFLCHATNQESPAAWSGSEAPETGPPVLRDRAVRAAMAAQHPPTAHGPMDSCGGWALGGAVPACQLNGGKATEIKL